MKIVQMGHETRSLPLPELVDHVIAHSGLIEHYNQDREGADRVENLNELVNAAAAFAIEADMSGLPAGVIVNRVRQTVGDPLDIETMDDADQIAIDPMQEGFDGLSPLMAFLSHAALEAGDNQAQAGQDAVQLMTVHAAKGLEFDAVFITGMEEGLFPHENSASDPSGLEEERRLMYVAITRARERLYFSLAQCRMLHGQTRYAMRSRFLSEVPDEHLKWITPKQGFSETEPRWKGALHSGADAFGRPSTGRMTPLPARSVTSGVTVGSQQFRVGQGVKHARFGEGTIIGLSGSGLEAQAQIQFREVGLKTLALGVAKLDITQS